MEHTAFRNMRIIDIVWIVPAANAEYADLLSGDIEAGQGINQGDHYWIICPYTTVNERIALLLMRLEINGCGGCGFSDCY